MDEPKKGYYRIVMCLSEKEWILKKNRAVIFGCGANYHRYKKQLDNRYEIVGLIDNSPYKRNDLVGTIDILEKVEYDDVVVTAMMYEDIEEQLLEYGVDKERIKIAALDYDLYCFESFGCTYYGQHCDDLIVAAVFARIGIEKPTYIDLGANHPVIWNNTALMHRNGCKGINVEANPDLIRYFEIKRPDDINLNVGVATKSGKLPYYVFTKDSGLNTFSKEEADKADIPIREVIELPVITLDEIITTHCPDGFPDYLDCDIEGLDYDVLEQYDLKTNGPKVICVEVRTDETERFDVMLSDKGYYRFCRVGENNIYVRDTYRDVI